MHWHAHAVGCLSFSEDGAYLLSGGEEAVLVAWDAATGRRTYLPRLGGPLVGLATCPGDPAKYALRQADNTIRVVGTRAMVSSFQVVWKAVFWARQRRAFGGEHLAGRLGEWGSACK